MFYHRVMHQYASRSFIGKRAEQLHETSGFKLFGMKATPGKNIQLKVLLAGMVDLPDVDDRVISGIAIDSRMVEPGNLFIAYRGGKSDGRDYIDQAIALGAVAVICEDESSYSNKVGYRNGQIPIIITPDIKMRIGILADQFYGQPSKKLKVIGVTGTNGKTSITHFIASILTSNNYPCGIIGTLGAGFPGNLKTLINTTPDPVTIHRLLFELHQQGAKAVAMEVSSVGIVQGRVSGIDFFAGVFTNLTRDHLDYHHDMESYGNAKKQLFLRPELRYAVINYDDPFGRQLIAAASSSIGVFAYSINNGNLAVPTTFAKEIKLNERGLIATITTPWGNGRLLSNLLGKFNLSNLLAAVNVIALLGFELEKILDGVAKLQTVTGRMQVLGGGGKPLIVIDYAHTPDALEKTLMALREHCQGSLWCVFGCGGDRDSGKRPIMGQIAERYSDHVIITNDNPRSEDPEKIVRDVLSGLLCPWAAEIEYDRRVAIAHAIDCAHANDIVLIAGKGHESYQIIGAEKFPFSDYDEAKGRIEN